MGYSYDSAGRLCCDFCGQSGGVRKFRCPFGYCQAYAACPACRRSDTCKRCFSRAYHREQGCEKQHAEMAAREARRQALLTAGRYVRCSALAVETNHGPMVHVLFVGARGDTVGHLMTHATYDAFPLLEPQTPEDYRAVGPLYPAAPAFSFGGRTKELVLR